MGRGRENVEGRGEGAAAAPASPPRGTVGRGPDVVRREGGEREEKRERREREKGEEEVERELFFCKGEGE